MEAVIAAVIVGAYLAGRLRENRRWSKHRDNAIQLVEQAIEERKQARHAFDVQMDVIRTQRELLLTFAEATDRIYAHNGDPEAWRRLAFAAHRVRTETT